VSSHHDKLSKKARKKAALLKRNRFHQEIFQWLRLRRGEEERVKKLDEAKKPAPNRTEKDDSKDWSDKVAIVRNRLDGHKRASKERWNRFAGTENSTGARGL
jgi:predicted Fe-S protein YdhL (DUF1289 family)